MRSISILICFVSSSIFAQSNYQRTWATYFGANSFESRNGKIDSEGNMYVVGNVQPWENIASYDSFSTIGAHQPQVNGGREGVIIKFSPAGNLLWCTYFGSEGDDVIYDLAISNQNELFICGSAEGSSGIVTLPPDFVIEDVPNNRKGFLAKFSSTGELLWGKYVPGIISEIIINPFDELYAAGITTYENYVATPGSFDEAESANPLGSLFISKYNLDGLKLWGTFYGSGGFNAICSDNEDNLYVAGTRYIVPFNYYFTPGSFQSDLGENTRAFITKFNAAGQRLWSTHYGSGTQSDSQTAIYSMDTDDESLYITGLTNASSGISTPGSYQQEKAGPAYDPSGSYQWDSQDAFITKFDLSGVRIWSTYFGGEYCDVSREIEAADNKIFIIGNSKSFSGISTPEAFQPNLSATPGPGDMTDYFDKFDNFVAEFSTAGERNWTTYFGGDKNDGWFVTRSGIEVKDGSLFIFGITRSENNIATPGAFQSTYIAPVAPPPSQATADGSDWGYNMFLARLDPAPLAIDSYIFESLVLFPNPNNGNFTLRASSGISDLEIKIIDMQGRIVSSKSIISDGLLAEINVHNQLQSGFYFVKVSSFVTSKTFKIFVE